MSEVTRGFTARALAVGALVGAVGTISNVYVSLKAGWSLPVMATAAVVGLGVARAQRRALTGDEAVVSTSLASATAYATGGGNLAAVPALVLLGHSAPAPAALALWFGAIALFGTAIAPLLGARLRELTFPTASATATLVREGAGPSARSLWIATLVASAYALARRALRVPPTIGPAGAYTFGLDPSLLLVAVGGLMTWTTAWSTLLGGVLTYGVVAPRLARAGLADPSYRSIVGVMVWPAAALLVASALTELALDLPRLAARSTGARARGPWVVVAGALALVVGRVVFGLSPAVLVAAPIVAVAFSYVAARSMGETDVVPTKALAPLAQALVGLLGHGIVGPGIAPNLTGAAAIHAADTVGSLKLASTLGVPPRAVFVARSIGSVVGAAIVVVAFRAIVPDVRALPTAELPVPAVLVWKGVAEVVARGALPPAMVAPIVAGAALGVVLAVIARAVPARWRRYVPSAMGIGSGMVLPASSAIAVALGGLARRRLEPRSGVAATVAIASGAIAGESVVAVLAQLVG